MKTAGELARLAVRIHQAEAAGIGAQKTVEAVRESLDILDGVAAMPGLEDALVEFTESLKVAGERLSCRLLEATVAPQAGATATRTQPVNALGRKP